MWDVQSAGEILLAVDSAEEYQGTFASCQAAQGLTIKGKSEPPDPSTY
jgi:hypothetical protein